MAAADLGAGLDWKTSLQELSAAMGLGAPVYDVDGEGPDHARTFTARAVVDGVPRGVGVGRAKKVAEQDAAADAYRVLERAALGAGLTRRPDVPELPEVETVRDGLARHVLGRTVLDVEVRRDYSVRRHVGGPLDFAGRLTGRRLDAAVRRGKFLWLLLDDEDDALMAHLGMSGQLLVRTEPVDHPHLRVRLTLDDGYLDFVDQRTFGHLSVPDLVPTPDGGPGGLGSAARSSPSPSRTSRRDLLDPALDHAALVQGVRRGRPASSARCSTRRSCPASATSTPTRASGVRSCTTRGPPRPCGSPRSSARSTGAREVMTEALAQGGTSFDALYVNVNGNSGYFDRSLKVYGQEGRPCPRCGTPVRRDEFMNRSSFTCPHCQPRPRNGRF